MSEKEKKAKQIQDLKDLLQSWNDIGLNATSELYVKLVEVIDPYL